MFPFAEMKECSLGDAILGEDGWFVVANIDLLCYLYLEIQTMTKCFRTTTRLEIQVETQKVVNCLIGNILKK